ALLEEPALTIVNGSEAWAASPAIMPVVNLSLGPTSTAYPAHPADPINFASWVMSSRQLCIFAAGNHGAARETETMSAWAEMPWVLAVGATADAVGATLATYSSRGVPG